MKFGLINEFKDGQRSAETRAFTKAYGAFQTMTRRYVTLLAMGTAALSSAIESEPEIGAIHHLNQTFSKMAQGTREKELLPADVQHMEILGNMLVMYSNDEFIGTRVMPILSTSGKLNGNYWEMSKEDRTAYPEDTVGIGGRVEPNELNESREEKEYNCKVRSYKEHLEWHTVENQAAPLDEIMDALFNVLYGLYFKREDRIAQVVFDANNYSTTNKVTLAATDRFENSGGDPFGVIDDAKASIWGGNNAGQLVLVCGRSAYKALKFHTSLLQRVTGGATTDRQGTISQRVMAELLEVDQVLVGSVRKNTGTKASPTYSRMWTPTSIALVRVAQTPSRRTASFGYTFDSYAPKHQMFWLPERGAAGCYMARATIAYVPKVVAADTSYLISSATSS